MTSGEQAPPGTAPPGEIARLWAGPLGRWLASRLQPTENGLLLVLATCLGLVCGLASVGFHELIAWTSRLFLSDVIWSHPSLSSPLRYLLAPALGALLSGLLIWRFARHDAAHGTPAVMEAVALRGGRLPERPMLVKVLGAGLTIGSGGSAGPEDPSVQLGAVVGSYVGRKLHLSDARARTLVTAGVASAIAAAFNAPIAGVFFALEIIAGEFSTPLFAPVVLAAVSASVVSRWALGAAPAFPVPPYTVITPSLEVPFYGLLGVCCAVVGALFVQAIFRSEKLFQLSRLPLPARAGLGGLLVGAIGLAFPGVYGVGYEVTGEVLNGRSALGGALALFLIAKFVSTAITVGAGGVGGTFAPSLVLGAAVGGLFGQGMNHLFPGSCAPPAAWALVGMGATLTAVVHAPITAVLLLFEITGDYHIILPIMASVVTATLFSRRLHPESIYTERLLRKGIQLRFGRDVNILEVVRVEEVMTRDFPTVSPELTLKGLEALIGRTFHHGFPLLSPDGRLEGMVSLADLQQAREAGHPSSTPVSQVATTRLTTLFPDQTLHDALRCLGSLDVGRLPVVDRADPSRLLGVLQRNDMVKAYQLGAMRRSELDHRLEQMQASSRAGSHLLELTLSQDSRADGRAIRDLRLPPRTIISAIRRGERSLIPQGDSVLRAGDQLSVLVEPDQKEKVIGLLTQEEAVDDGAPRYEQWVLPADAWAVGRAVASLQLPPEALIIVLFRQGRLQTVHGDTVLEAGDELTMVAPGPDLVRLKRLLMGDGGPG